MRATWAKRANHSSMNPHATQHAFYPLRYGGIHRSSSCPLLSPERRSAPSLGGAIAILPVRSSDGADRTEFGSPTFWKAKAR